jgi:hypothetical protein
MTIFREGGGKPPHSKVGWLRFSRDVRTRVDHHYHRAKQNSRLVRRLPQLDGIAFGVMQAAKFAVVRVRIDFDFDSRGF